MHTSWSPVALSVDIPAGLVIPAVVPGAELAVWRSASGRLAACQDRCPHRGMRLSHGFVRDEMLSCLYHGWRYDSTGHCRKIPAHPALVPPGAICAETAECAEQGGLVWVAPHGTTDPIPELAPGEPLCSLPVAVPYSAVHAALGLAGPCGEVTLPGMTGPGPLQLALQERGSGCTVHALLPPGSAMARRRTALAELEHWRRALEAHYATPTAATTTSGAAA